MTLITNRYSYVPMSRVNVDGSRLYQTPSGERLASVTTILDKTKPQDQKDALAAWKASVGAAKAAEITTQAANRGTRMHKFLEDMLLTGTLTAAGSNPYSQISRAMAEQIVTNAFPNVNEFWGSEVALCYDGLYAGTTDCVGVWKGKEAILDFKQSNKPKKREYITDYFLQLVFYGTAHNKMFGSNIKTGVILMCVQPKVDDMMNIIETPQYQEFSINETEWNYYETMMWDRVQAYYCR